MSVINHEKIVRDDTIIQTKWYLLGIFQPYVTVLRIAYILDWKVHHKQISKALAPLHVVWRRNLLIIQSATGWAPFSRTTPMRFDSCQWIGINSAAKEHEGLSHRLLAIASMGSFDEKKFHLCHLSAFGRAEDLLSWEKSFYFQPYLSMSSAFPPYMGGPMALAPNTAESIPTSGP